jgi:hypothetical protein
MASEAKSSIPKLFSEITEWIDDIEELAKFNVR